MKKINGDSFSTYLSKETIQKIENDSTKRGIKPSTLARIIIENHFKEKEIKESIIEND